MQRQHNRKIGPMDVEGALTKEESTYVLDLLLSNMIRKRAEAKRLGNTLIGNSLQHEVKLISSAIKKIQQIS